MAASYVSERRITSAAWWLLPVATGSAVAFLVAGRQLLENPVLPLVVVVTAPFAVVHRNLRRGSRDLFALDSVVSLAMLPLVALGTAALLWLSPRREVQDQHLALALWYALAGFAAFLVGYHSGMARRAAARLPLLSGPVDDARRRIAIAALLLLAGTAWLIFASSFGGVGALISRLDWATRHSGGRYALVCVILQFKTAFLLWYAGRLRAGKESPLLVIALMLCTIAVVSIIGAKFLASDLVISTLVLRHYMGERVRYWQAGAAVVLLAALIFLLLAVRIAGSELYRLGNRRLSVLASIYLHRECPGPRVLAEAVHRIPSQRDFLYGRGLAAAIVVFVPRWLYRDKPEGTGAMLTRAFFPLRYRVGIREAPTVITEFYANFGVAGVLGGMWLLGALFAILYHYHLRCGSEASAILYSINVVGILSYLRGDAAGGGAFWIIYAIPALVALTLASERAAPAPRWRARAARWQDGTQGGVT